MVNKFQFSRLRQCAPRDRGPCGARATAESRAARRRARSVATLPPVGTYLCVHYHRTVRDPDIDEITSLM